MASDRMFQPLEGETAIVVQGGVYKEAPLYVRSHGELFAKVGGGFIRLYAAGSTSVSKIRLDTLQMDGLHKDKFGKLCASAGPEGSDRKRIGGDEPFLGLTKD